RIAYHGGMEAGARRHRMSVSPWLRGEGQTAREHAEVTREGDHDPDDREVVDRRGVRPVTEPDGRLATGTRARSDRDHAPARGTARVLLLSDRPQGGELRGSERVGPRLRERHRMGQ